MRRGWLRLAAPRFFSFSLADHERGTIRCRIHERRSNHHGCK
jgi:hypothetical protein